MSSTTETLNVGDEPTSKAAGAPGLVKLYAPEAGVPDAIPLDAEVPLVIGREAPANLVLPFGSVSREHARVVAQADRWLVLDLQSRNGTFVNGSRIHESALTDGDELRLGAVVFKFCASGVERFLDASLAGRSLPDGVAPLIGGASLAQIRAEILRVARADLSVLVLGESGTGKELVARALHASSGRAGAFAAVNCAAVPAALLEAELFGAKRGAFTGADRDRLGLVRSAEGGTLFLDEIGDMPLEAQAKLLRMLDTRHVTPLGSHVAEAVDVRVVSATHRPIVQLVQEQRFRADLYARISAHTIVLPPLRERKEDLTRMVESFLARHGGAYRVTPGFMIGLLRYDWPLNVRELETTIKRAVALADGPTLDEPQLSPAVREAVRAARANDQAPTKIPFRSNAPPEAELRALLRKHAGNVAGVSRELGKDRVQIHRWLKLYGLSVDDFRP